VTPSQPAERGPRPVRRPRSARGSGDRLRAEILAATKDLLRAAGRADDVSIRAVAEAVGVTTPSIYLHFKDKDALLTAVVLDVLRDLDEAMLAAAEGETDPLPRMRAYGLAYVRWALDHAEHYRLATMDPHSATEEGQQREMDEMLRQSAFVHFHETVLACLEQGTFIGEDALAITFELWATAHGVAALLIAKPHLPVGDAIDFADRVLRAAALGHAAQPPPGFPYP